jgi:hypothetical protein
VIDATTFQPAVVSGRREDRALICAADIPTSNGAP